MTAQKNGGDFSAESFWKFFRESPACRLNLLREEKVQVLMETESTNSVLMNLGSNQVPLLDPSGNLTEAGKSLDLNLCASACQTKGRGRLGRTFVSPDSTGIYFSLSIVAPGGIHDPGIYTVTSCVAVCRAIEKLYGTKCSIKWVNDIYCGGKKICGILTEGIVNSQAARIEGAVIGIGINILSSSEFSGDLKSKAGGILDERANGSGQSAVSLQFNRSQLLAECINQIILAMSAEGLIPHGESSIDGLKTTPAIQATRTWPTVLDEYRSRSILMGKTVTVTQVIGSEDSRYSATVTGISDDYGLLVRLADGECRTLHSGEVSLHETKL